MNTYTPKYLCIGLMLLAAASVSGMAQTTAPTPAAAQGQTAPGATATPLPSETALIGDLIDDPASKAVLDKDIPGLTTNSHINYLRSRTLKEVQVLANGKITDEQIVQTDKDLMALPKKPADAAPATPPQ